jgi:predicted permease
MKKTAYIILTIFLGFLLAEMAHWSLEAWYINFIIANGGMPHEHIFLASHCFLPVYVQFALIALGLVGGYFLGQTWWRIVYVEHRHWRKR